MQQPVFRLRSAASESGITYIDSLGVVTEPIAKVDALDVHLGELLVAGSAAHQQGEQSVFDVAMAPVLALDLGRRGDVAGAESMARAREEDKQHQAGEEKGRREPKGRHGGRSGCVNSEVEDRMGMPVGWPGKMRTARGVVRMERNEKTARRGGGVAVSQQQRRGARWS